MNLIAKILKPDSGNGTSRKKKEIDPHIVSEIVRHHAQEIARTKHLSHWAIKDDGRGHAIYSTQQKEVRQEIDKLIAYLQSL